MDVSWLYNGGVDVELKQYQFLAYTQRVAHDFDQLKVYPKFYSLDSLYHNLCQLVERKSTLYNAWSDKQSIKSIQNLKVIRNRPTQLSEVDRVDEMLEFALPRLEVLRDKGEKLVSQITQEVQLTPVGIEPIYRKEGYLFLADDKSYETHVFRYKSVIHASVDHCGLEVDWMEAVNWSPAFTFTKLKHHLITSYGELPNPGVYAAQYRSSLPMNEAVLPVATGMLAKHIA